ncbi:SCAN domain-containing protein 3, partial [Dictyocoela muelleri]
MKFEDRELKILDKCIFKIFIGLWEKTKIGIILYNQHNPSHICADKLFKKISEEYISIKREIVREYIQKCEACKMANSFKGSKRLTYITAHKIHERMFIDIIDLKKYVSSNDGYKYILTCFDSFSKFAFCYPLYNKNSPTVAEKLDELCAVEGKWEKIQTDNGKEFCNSDFNNIIKKYKMVHIK